MNFAHWFLTLLCPGGGIKWLRDDEFSDERAAGAVNGTPATPGPGTRIAVDAGGDALSIGGGAVNFANLNEDYGDPSLQYASVSRTSGRVMIWHVTFAATDEHIRIGLDDQSPPTITTDEEILHFENTAKITYRVDLVNVGAYAASAYACAMILRTQGGYVLIKGGAYTDWTLLWISSSSAVGTLYPTVANYNAAPTIEWIRIPDELWLPTPLCYDTFTRADGAIGVSETVGPDSQSVAARTWNNRIGTTQIAINAASASALTGGIALATVDTGTADIIVGATLVHAGDEVGVVLRYVDADNYIRAIHDGTNCKLIKRVAAAETDVISAVVALGAGAICVISDGTSFSLFLNGAKVGSTSTISDAALQTGTEQGLFSTNLGNAQDDFSVFARGTNGEYSKLDKWSS